MALREKFGKLVLLEETDASALGRESRAARLGPAGLDRLVSVLRLSPAISAHAEATKRLVDEARLAARLPVPGFVRVLGIGRVEQSFYVSSESVEGRSLATVLARCREDAFPFATDHALTIASRVAQALGSLHGKKDDAGTPLIHGLVAPSRIMVAFDGEVKVKGLGLWRALAGTDLLPEEERRYLAPEQAAGGPGEPSSDVYTLGRILLETLTGQAPDGTDPLRALATAQVTNTVGEHGPLPGPLAELLRRALDPEPASRFPRMADMGKALDALLFSGDFAPTTFDLAFFMHTLFRDQMEQEAQALEEALRADYGEFLVAETPAAPATAPPPPSAATTAVPPPTHVEAVRPTEPDLPSPPRAGLGPDASGARATASRASREASAREAAARMTLGSIPAPPPSRRGLWLLLGLLGAVAAGGGAGWLYFVKLRVPASPPPTTLSPEAVAAQERVRELEARIVQLEREKGEAETKAAEDARKSLEAQAAARGGPADPAAVEQAQEEARRRARAEQDRKQLEERRRLEDQKMAEEKRLAEASPSPAPTPTPEPPPVAAAEPVPATAPSTTLPAPATPSAAAAPPAAGDVPPSAAEPSWRSPIRP